MTALAPHPDRLLPTGVSELGIARRLYAEVAAAPIYSPHGHVDARLLVENQPFPDPAALLITPDHYVTRLLHANGVPLRRLGLSKNGRPPEVDGLEIWRAFSANWHRFLGTPVRFWLETELSDVFGLREQPSPANADAVYAQLSAKLAEPGFRPRALFDRFGIRVLATTDDPADDLAAHEALRSDPSFAAHVLPTFRADRYMTPAETTWTAALDRLSAASGIDCGSYLGLLDALRNRREYFIAHGATATDTGVIDAGSDPLTDADAERLHRAGIDGTITPEESAAYRRNMLYRFAEMSAEDSLVMQLHAGVIRNSHRPTFDAYGPDTGHDVPAVTEFTTALSPILQSFGTHPNLRLVLFTVDETSFSRDIAPLAGFYPTVFAGAPWWFLDAPAAIRRYRQAVTETIGFGKTSGFIDDTRAFCSIPARHDMSRRLDAAYLATLVAEHQLTEEDALEVARALVSTRPIETFRLPA